MRDIGDDEQRSVRPQMPAAQRVARATSTTGCYPEGRPRQPRTRPLAVFLFIRLEYKAKEIVWHSRAGKKTF